LFRQAFVQMPSASTMPVKRHHHYQLLTISNVDLALVLR
jgi:hypothetical protein